MLYEKLKALLSALPAQLALVQSVLTVVAVEVVPLLPENIAVQAVAVLVVVLGWVATAVRVVRSVTPVPSDAQGLLVPAGRELNVTVDYDGGRSGINTRR